MGREFLSEDEFDEWLTPSQALDRLPGIWPRSTKIEWIATRIADGVIDSAADMVFVRGQPEEHLVLARSDWAEWDHARDEQFWIAGDYNGTLVVQISESTEPMRVPFRAYDVRLDPARFDERAEAQQANNLEGWGRALKPVADLIEAQIKAKAPPPSTTEMFRDIKVGTFPQSVIDQWFADLAPEDQAKGIRWLWSKAKADIGPGVKRKQIEPFTKGREPGRPPKN